MGYYIRHLFERAYWSMTPILYSFRRCPYAIRTRMSLRYASITVELREVFLANKPEAMLMLSAKGTVPVLQLDSQVLDESLDIMYWALRQADREQWLRPELEAETLALITENDGSFKTHLDHYKYWDRYPTQTQEHYRQQAERFLSKLEGLWRTDLFCLLRVRHLPILLYSHLYASLPLSIKAGSINPATLGFSSGWTIF